MRVFVILALILGLVGISAGRTKSIKPTEVTYERNTALHENIIEGFTIPRVNDLTKDRQVIVKRSLNNSKSSRSNSVWIAQSNDVNEMMRTKYAVFRNNGIQTNFIRVMLENYNKADKTTEFARKQSLGNLIDIIDIFKFLYAVANNHTGLLGFDTKGKKKTKWQVFSDLRTHVNSSLLYWLSEIIQGCLTREERIPIVNGIRRIKEHFKMSILQHFAIDLIKKGVDVDFKSYFELPIGNENFESVFGAHKEDGTVIIIDFNNNQIAEREAEKLLSGGKVTTESTITIHESAFANKKEQ